jgi:hypothetical protein
VFYFPQIFAEIFTILYPSKCILQRPAPFAFAKASAGTSEGEKYLVFRENLRDLRKKNPPEKKP